MPRIGEPADHEVWTTQDVAAYLRITDHHVVNLAKRGEIKGKKFGSVWRFRRQDILGLWD